MKKLVNGQVVAIDNIELFELAAEGLTIKNTTVSNTSEGIQGDINSAVVKNCIEQYDRFFRYLPFPLYSIERRIKYATLANLIRYFSKTPVEMWVTNGLYIRVNRETGLTLRVVNGTWGVVYVKEVESDNTSLDLYRDDVGYEQYAWVLNRIINRESTSDFYNVFLGDFVKACNGEKMVLKWELENILNFSTTPKEIKGLRDNVIINIDRNEEYTIDIFCKGAVETGKQIETWSLGANGAAVSKESKKIWAYDFEAYRKSLTLGVNEKMEHCDISGLHSMFMKLCGIKNGRNEQTFPIFRGIVYDCVLAFVVNKTLFVTRSNRLAQTEEVANGVELYAADSGKIYFKKTKKVSEAVNKNVIYSYNTRDQSIRLCKIYFDY